MPDERILVVDDEADVLDMCVRALGLEGYQVTAAHNGLEAIETVKQGEFDLLLTDIKMPGMTGLQAYQTMRQHKPDLIAVAITGYGAVDTAIEALKLGMADFILKPFSLDELSAAISKALARKRLERENARLRALIPLFQLSQAFMSVTDLGVLLQQVMQIAVKETSANIGVLMLENEANGQWTIGAVVTDDSKKSPDRAYVLSADIIQRVAESQQPVPWSVESSPGTFFASSKAGTLVTAAAALPLLNKGQTIGILGLGKRQKDAAFAPSDMELLSVLASQAAIAIQNARLFTRTRNAYDKLASLDHLKGEFISIAAHELRTPLAEINTYLALLGQGASAAAQTHLDAISRAADRLGLLMNNLTDLKFLEAGQVELRRTCFSMPELISSVLEPLNPLAAGKGQTVHTTVADGLSAIWIDGPKIKILLQNLIMNAIAFTPEGGTISIEAGVEGTSLRVAVRDTGVGIPEEEWEWIFKPFYQLESSLIREHGGMGVGLATAKNIVDLHGGRIWLESTMGRGSTFFFTIPDCIP